MGGLSWYSPPVLAPTDAIEWTLFTKKRLADVQKF